MFNFIKKNALWVRIGAGVALIAGVVLALVSCLVISGKTYTTEVSGDLTKLSKGLVGEVDLDYTWDFKDDEKMVVDLKNDKTNLFALLNLESYCTEHTELQEAKKGEVMAALTAAADAQTDAALQAVVPELTLAEFGAAVDVDTWDDARKYAAKTAEPANSDTLTLANAQSASTKITKVVTALVMQAGLEALKDANLAVEYKLDGGKVYVKSAVVSRLLKKTTVDYEMFGFKIGGWIISADLIDAMNGGSAKLAVTNTAQCVEFVAGVVLGIVALVAEGFVCAAVYKKKD